MRYSPLLSGDDISELRQVLAAVAPLHIPQATRPPVAMRADNVLRTSAAAIAEAVDSTPAQQVARPPINADFISVSQVATLLGLARTTLWARVQRKSFPAPSMKSGRQSGYRIAEIDAYLAKLETK